MADIEPLTALLAGTHLEEDDEDDQSDPYDSVRALEPTTIFDALFTHVAEPFPKRQNAEDNLNAQPRPEIGVDELRPSVSPQDRGPHTRSMTRRRPNLSPPRSSPPASSSSRSLAISVVNPLGTRIIEVTQTPAPSSTGSTDKSKRVIALMKQNGITSIAFVRDTEMLNRQHRKLAPLLAQKPDGSLYRLSAAFRCQWAIHLASHQGCILTSAPRNYESDQSNPREQYFTLVNQILYMSSHPRSFQNSDHRVLSERGRAAVQRLCPSLAAASAQVDSPADRGCYICADSPAFLIEDKRDDVADEALENLDIKFATLANVITVRLRNDSLVWPSEITLSNQRHLLLQQFAELHDNRCRRSVVTTWRNLVGCELRDRRTVAISSRVASSVGDLNRTRMRDFVTQPGQAWRLGDIDSFAPTMLSTYLALALSPHDFPDTVSAHDGTALFISLTSADSPAPRNGPSPSRPSSHSTSDSQQGRLGQQEPGAVDSVESATSTETLSFFNRSPVPPPSQDNGEKEGTPFAEPRPLGPVLKNCCATLDLLDLDFQSMDVTAPLQFRFCAMPPPASAPRGLYCRLDHQIRLGVGRLGEVFAADLWIRSSVPDSPPCTIPSLASESPSVDLPSPRGNQSTQLGDSVPSLTFSDSSASNEADHPNHFPLKVAIKIACPAYTVPREDGHAYTSLEAEAAFHNEVDIYSQLEHLQGSVIPLKYGSFRIWCSATPDESGWVVLRDGSSGREGDPNSGGAWVYLHVMERLGGAIQLPADTLERAEISRLYHKLHSAGVRHNDISERHILGAFPSLSIYKQPGERLAAAARRPPPQGSAHYRIIDFEGAYRAGPEGIAIEETEVKDWFGIT